jgi:hypothetical protein
MKVRTTSTGIAERAGGAGLLAEAQRALAGRAAFLRSVWPVWLGPVLLLGPGLVSGRVLFWGTPALQFVAWWWQCWQQISVGKWPLWNALNGMGAPLLANYQTAFFYPPNWLLLPLAWVYGPAGIAWGYSLLAMLHLMWAGLGMSYLLRRLQFGWLAQVIGGLSFGLTGYVVGRLGFFSMTWVAAWLPWLIYFASGLAHPGQALRATLLPFRLSLGLAAVLAMQLLAGHAQLTWYSLLLAGAWVACGALCAGGIKNAGLRLAELGAAGLLAVVTTAVQLVPTFQYLQNSQRSDSVAAGEALRYSFWPWRFISLISPDFFGNPGIGDFWGFASYWEDHAYPGLVVLLLALASLVILVKGMRPQRRSERWGLVLFGWLLLVVSFVLALGANTPVFPFLYHYVPTFDMFQAPARYLLWAAFSLPLLAAAASERWRSPTGRGLYWFRLGTAGAFAVTLGALIAWFTLRDVRLTFVRATALTGIWGLGVGLLTLAIPWAAKRGRMGLWRGAVAAWLLFDLLAAGWLLNPTVHLDFYRGAGPLPTSILAMTAEGRVYLDPITEYDLKFRRFLRFSDFNALEDWRNMRVALLPNLNLLDGISSANNFDPLVPGRYARWMAGLAEAAPQDRPAWLSFMNVALLEEIDVSQPGGVRYDLTPSAVRSGDVRWYSCVLRVASEEQAWEATTARLSATADVEPRVLVLEQADAAAEGVQCAGLSLARVDRFVRSPNQMYLEIEGSGSGWVMLSEGYDPDWQVSIDGQPGKLYAGNYLFMAVPVASGKHQIVFTYRPFGFYFGGLFSILGLMWFIIFLAARYKRRS